MKIFNYFKYLKAPSFYFFEVFQNFQEGYFENPPNRFPEIKNYLNNFPQQNLYTQHFIPHLPFLSTFFLKKVGTEIKYTASY